jgi:hypothetical protein
MLAITANICYYGKSEEEKRSIKSREFVQEDLRLDIYERCATRALTLMTSHIRDETCRNLLKKCLNTLCNFIDPHICDMKAKGCWTEEDADDEKADYENSYENKWRQCLYKIVIAIVRTLRLDFENENHNVEIELVIYFYELLKV